jgi:hypothetical protein
MTEMRLARRLLYSQQRIRRREDVNMVPIDMTAELSSLLVGMNVLMLIAAAAVAVSPWVSQITTFLSHDLRSEPRLAVVGNSSSAPLPKREDAPSDASVPEAA